MIKSELAREGAAGSAGRTESTSDDTQRSSLLTNSFAR